MSEFYGAIWEALSEGNIKVKFDKFSTLYERFLSSDKTDFSSPDSPNELKNPSYFGFLNTQSLYQKKQKPRDKSEKEAMFLHSVAHIEYSAVDIALDACYRFRGLPRQYYEDWLEVADDEIRHFNILNALLQKRGIKYGDFSVHDGLFVALQKTSHSLLERMAVLPRYMEANGLDANAHAIDRLRKEGAAQDILQALEVILAEEISHVKKGDFWYKFACAKAGVKPGEYINIVQNHYPKAFLSSREINEAARLAAGFSQDELEKIKNLSQGQI
ncbi:ferritin-like domain-containing protein [Campylobacter sp. 19-13652]|uniref:ferritin-like domain-containing protein n=1 Tax=Campylobacter sp. 19-13652 TaxID=2840180 RepID=UPI001C751082|nr:ferritin-like domain-containing protein [Campylobacter sp. 19-13652]BCX79435.1 hypothetical protein LBC_08970 [Campylobacter sp. 19-13652]